MTDLGVRRASATDRPAMERLWQLFRHDLSEFGGQRPDADGAFRSERLQASYADADWAPYLLTDRDLPVGLALVRGLSGPVRVLNSFFVARAVRRTGIGLWAAREVVSRHPGRWEVAFQDDNPAAVRFWRRVGTETAGSAWTEERRPVPGRPESPPDVWISFSVPATASPQGAGVASAT